MWKKIWNWLKTSHRYLHLLGGAILGIMSCCWWCAILVGGSTAGALELKDYLYNGSRLTAWDWIDFALTIAGAVFGYGVVALTNGLC